MHKARTLTVISIPVSTYVSNKELSAESCSHAVFSGMLGNASIYAVDILERAVHSTGNRTNQGFTAFKNIFPLLEVQEATGTQTRLSLSLLSALLLAFTAVN